LLPNFLWPIKVFIVKSTIKAHGENFKFGPQVMMYNYREIEVGNNVFIGDGTTIGGNVPVKIGNNVMFGPEVMIRGGDHNISVVGLPMAKVKTGGVNLPITIEDDVWIGTRTIILKGVTISEGAVVGAGSIVNKKIHPYTINVGSPSRPISSRFTRDDLKGHLTSVVSRYSIEEIDNLYKEHSIRFRNVK